MTKKSILFAIAPAVVWYACSTEGWNTDAIVSGR